MSSERPAWLPEWSMRDAVEIGLARKHADDIGREAQLAGTFRTDPRVTFGNGVRHGTAWAVSDLATSPNRNRAPGPARDVDDVRLEITLTKGKLDHAAERLRPYGLGYIAGLEWLIADCDVIVYPGGHVYRPDPVTLDGAYPSAS